MNILLVEDNPGDVLIIDEMLKNVVGTEFNLVHTNRLESALQNLQKDNFDAMLLDLGLLDSQGMDTFVTIRVHSPELPIVILTGLTDEDFAVKAIGEGAQDYLIKGQIDGRLLIRSIRYAIERKNSEMLIKKSLEEKNLLIKEIHHRVKNNLMVISGLLNLQSRYIHDKNDLEFFKESQSRAKSMALIHERLYQSDNFKSIDFGEYIVKLSNDLFHTYNCDASHVKFDIEVENIMVDVDTAIPLGLIVNELLSNSLKHGFPDARSGDIKIKFHRYHDKLQLIVKDDGIGLSGKIDYKNTDSLGLQLVNLLTGQIDGELEVNMNGGTEFIISFTELNFNLN
ncbi:MAG: histidine kinase dimerization/phosphoacceptor domain -containing protein [Methanobacterium sp.]